MLYAYSFTLHPYSENFLSSSATTFIKLDKFVVEWGWCLEQTVTDMTDEVKGKCMEYYKWALSICRLYRRRGDEGSFRP